MSSKSWFDKAAPKKGGLSSAPKKAASSTIASKRDRLAQAMAKKGK